MSKKQIVNTTIKKVRKKYGGRKKKPTGISIALSIIILIVAVAGYFAYEKFFKKPQTPVVAVGDLSFHFLTLGNSNTGDSIYIKAGDNDILIDAGSRANSVDDIDAYLDNYVTDNTLEFVIVTHADRDHIAGFAAANNIFELYTCETIIDFNKSNKELTTDAGNSSLYADYLANRDLEVDNGATHYTALDCYNNTGSAKRIYDLAPSIQMEILYNYYYDHTASDENDYSVCLLFRHGSKKFLFTGDLEKKGEEKLAEFYGNYLQDVELYKAGHHGSKTSSNDCLLDIIKPKIVCVCCCAGSVEYLTTTPQNLSNSFPTQEFINRVGPWTDKIYVTTAVNVKYDTNKNKYVDDGEHYLLNGNIVVSSNSQSVSVTGTNNSLILKETTWFENNRVAPTLGWLSKR